MASTATQEEANGLATYLNVILSPTAAFQQLSRTPMWGWAAIVGIVLAMLTVFIMLPEQMKLASIEQAKAIANMPADQQAQARTNIAAASGVTNGVIFAFSVIVPWIFWIISSIVFVIGAAVSGASSKFSLAWVAALNSSAVAFLVGLVNAIIVRLSGPDAVAGPMDVQRIPSLAMLFPGNIKLDTFLATFSLGYVWYYFVAVIALEQLLRMKRPAAIVTVLLYALIVGGASAALAR